MRSQHLPAWLAVAVLAATAASSARPLQTDFWLTPELAVYRRLVDAYVDGQAAEAVEGVLTLDADAVHQIIETVREDDARLTGTDRQPGVNERRFRAAAMLHVDAADDLWARGLETAAITQLEVAVRWADLGARSPEPDGSFRRRWYLGVGLLAFERGGWRTGLSFVNQACEALPDDVPLLTTAAWLHEQLALAPVRLGNTGEAGFGEVRRTKRDHLLAAARRASAALAVAPDASEAALRLARALMLLEQVSSARQRLLLLVEGAGVTTPHRYLARLLLGELEARAGDPERAERLFRDASELIPEGPAARLALARLRDTRGDRRGAARVLEPILTAETANVIDPWVDYLLGVGNGPDLRAALRVEVRR